ncbi:MAG: FAD-dependent oxidoreductase [Candidatus Microsaccharimonas sp.]
MHVVVVGGGFGGVKAALELSKKQIGKITLISDESYFLHHATLYATATGKNIAESVIPLKQIFAHHPNVEIIQDKITAFHPERHLITGKKDYHYDKLVLALGSVTSYFGIKGMHEHSYGIKSLSEIKKFHEHIHDELVQQKLDKEYFIIGAGSTGVELASALNEYLKYLKTLYRLKQTASKVTLVEAAPRVVPHLSETASTQIARQLKKQHIKLLVNHKVEGLKGNSVIIEGVSYPTTTAIWTSGVINNQFFVDNADYFHLAPNGRVNVNPYLEALDDVYVIGDNNTVKYSGTAWPTLKQASHVAKNITRIATRRPQKAFNPTPAPSGVPVGSKWGYVEWYGLYVAGRSGAFARRMMELYGYCQLLPFKQAVAIWRAHDISAVDV